LQNVSVSLKEMMHGVYKKVIPHTNKKNVELDLIERDNKLQVIQYILDNGYDPRVFQDISNPLKSIIKDNKLKHLLEGWYILTPMENEEQWQDDG